MNMKELEERVYSFSYFLSGKYPHRYVCFDLRRKVNEELKNLLEESGYWEFAPRRSQRFVYMHQVMNFFDKGIHLPKGEGNNLENHHLDGNTLNNSPDNLIYLTKVDHELCSKYQRKLSRIKVKQFIKLQRGNDLGLRTMFNRRGKRIKNWVRFIIGIVCLTVYKSSQWLTKVQENVKSLPPIKEIVGFVSRFLKRLGLASKASCEHILA